MPGECGDAVCMFLYRMVLEVLGLSAVSRSICGCDGSVIGNGCLVRVSLLCPFTNTLSVCGSCQRCQVQLQLSCYWSKFIAKIL